MEEKDLNVTAEVPQIPLEAEMVDPNEVETVYDHMLGSAICFVKPARGTFSSLCDDRMGKCAMKNQLGTDRATAVVTGFDKSKHYFYAVPVAPGTKGSVEITRDASGVARINLLETFTKVGRKVPKGRREYYMMEFTPDKVKVGTVVGYGLYAHLPDVMSAAIQVGKRKKTNQTDPNNNPGADRESGAEQ